MMLNKKIKKIFKSNPWDAICRYVRYWWQRRIRGFDDYEIYGFYYNLAVYLVPRLEALHKKRISWFSLGKKDIEESQKVIDTFKKIVSGIEPHEDKSIEEGLQLFAKNYYRMWW